MKEHTAISPSPTRSHHWAPRLLVLMALFCLALQASAQERWDLDGNGSEDFLFRLTHNGITRLVGIATDGKKGISADDLGGKTHNHRDILGAGELDGQPGMDLLFRDRLYDKIGIWPINSPGYIYDKDMADYAPLPAPQPFDNFTFVAIGDLDGDGRDDLVLHRNDTNAVIYWLLGSGTNGLPIVKASGTLGTVNLSTYEILGAADMDGNGADDIMFHNKSTGRVVHWCMYPDRGVTGFISGSFGPAAYADYRIVGLRDLDADGCDDLIFHRKSTNTVVYWLYQRVGTTGIALKRTGSYAELININEWRIIDLRYLNNDGRADLLVQERVSGRVGYRLNGGINSSGALTTSAQGWYRQVPGPIAADIPGFPDHWRESAVVPVPVEEVTPSNPVPFATDTTDLLARNHTDGLNDAVYRNGRTFVTYPADDKQGACHPDPEENLCHSNPTLAVYDHYYDIWRKLTLDIQPYNEKNSPDPLADSHCYSQIMIGGDGKIHIFYSAHGHPLRHYTQSGAFNADSGYQSLLDLANWVEVGFPKVGGGQIDHQDLATYVMTFKRNNGDIYVLWRQTYVYQDPIGPSELNGDPCQLNQYALVEPWYYTKSEDDGKTWTAAQRFVDPQYGDSWDTMYLTLKYQPEQDRLHVAFSINKYHNCYSEALYYSYFTFSSNGVMLAHKANGEMYGYAINQWWAQNYLKVVDFGMQVPRPGGLVMDIDSLHRIHLIYTNFEGTALSNMRHQYWTGTAWSTPITLEASASALVAPLNLKINRSNNSFEVLTTFRGLETWVNSLERWKFGSLNATTASEKTTLMSLGETQKWIWEAMPVINGPDTHALILKVGAWSNWENPAPTGKLYLFGKDGTQP